MKTYTILFITFFFQFNLTHAQDFLGWDMENVKQEFHQVNSANLKEDSHGFVVAYGDEQEFEATYFFGGDLNWCQSIVVNYLNPSENYLDTFLDSEVDQWVQVTPDTYISHDRPSRTNIYSKKGTSYVKLMHINEPLGEEISATVKLDMVVMNSQDWQRLMDGESSFSENQIRYTHYVPKEVRSSAYINGQVYDAYQTEEIFQDLFNDNRNNWRKFILKIKRRSYHINTYSNDPPATTSIAIPVDTTRDYQIEAKVRLLENKSHEYMGVIWNRNMKCGYYIGFNADLKTTMYCKKNDDVIEVIEPEKLEVLSANYNYNIITIRKVNHEFLIYINKVMVYRLSSNIYEEPRSNTFYKDHIGFFVGRKSLMDVTSLTVSYLK